MSRFIKTTARAIGEEESNGYEWWLDTHRPINEPQKYTAVQAEGGKDPNNFIKHDKLHLLFTDQAEYYVVCGDCHSAYRGMQWSGGTSSYGWKEKSEKYLEKHTTKKGWCEFCDPIFGNGGWSLD